ncbi:MAG TPA: ATP-binding cassette domain-containing protein [Pseudonocardia sp.]|nr:ATP-binding cassette domain-containing protein [Pseudonocardia sp.]
MPPVVRASPTDAAPGAPDSTATPAISLRGLRKEFPGGVVAVRDLDLDIAEGEFVTLLGPSGSGKTTVLRLIAGFEQPSAGTVALRGRDGSPRSTATCTPCSRTTRCSRTCPCRVTWITRCASPASTERRERALEALATVRLDAMAERAPTAARGSRGAGGRPPRPTTGCAPRW